MPGKQSVVSDQSGSAARSDPGDDARLIERIACGKFEPKLLAMVPLRLSQLFRRNPRALATAAIASKTTTIPPVHSFGSLGPLSHGRSTMMATKSATTSSKASFPCVTRPERDRLSAARSRATSARSDSFSSRYGPDMS